MTFSEDPSRKVKRSVRSLLAVVAMLSLGGSLSSCAADAKATEAAVFGDAEPGICADLDVADDVLWLLTDEGSISFVGGSARAIGAFSTEDPGALGVANCAWSFGKVARPGELGLSWIEMTDAEWDEIVAQCAGCEAVDGVGDAALAWPGSNFSAYAVLSDGSIGWAYLFPSGASANELFSGGKGLELAQAAAAFSAAQ